MREIGHGWDMRRFRGVGKWSWVSCDAMTPGLVGALHLKSDWVLFVPTLFCTAVATALYPGFKLGSGIAGLPGLCAIGAGLWLSNPDRRAAQITALGVDRYLPLYRGAMAWALGVYRDWLRAITATAGGT